MDIDALLAEIQAAAEEGDAAALQRVVNAYVNMVADIQPYIDALTQWMEANKDNLSPASVKASSQYAALMSAIETEVKQYSAWVATELKADAQRSTGAGLLAGVLLLSSVTGTAQSELTAGGDDVVMQLVNEYLAKDGALMEKINGLAGYESQRVADVIIESVGLGRNPLTTARLIVEEGLGIGLSDAMRWTRTLQNYSYRWATLASYEANGIQGWIWWAELDDKVCMSCAALHGKVFPIEDGVANDHHNGRCAMIPYIPNVTDGFSNPNAGKDWFESLPAESQKQMMGAGKYEAYQAGAFEFSQQSATYESDIFGTMRREATLQELTK